VSPFMDPCTTLAAAIRDVLAGGIHLPESALAFIDAARGCAGPDALAALLADGADPDYDTLVALVFAPDETIQIRVEPLLESAHFTAADARTVAGSLVSPPARVRIHLPGGRGELTVALPEAGVVPFVERLKITRTLSHEFLAALDGRVPAPERDRAAVRLRDARAEPGEPGIRLLCRLIGRDPDPGDDLAGRIDYLLGFLTGVDDERTLLDRLCARKSACLGHLQKAVQTEKALAKGNVETFIAGGGRVLSPDIGALYREIAGIDRICLALFGRPARASGAVDLGEFPGEEGSAELIRRLTRI
jgi:hypothetical protein